MPRVIVRDTAAELPSETTSLGRNIFEGDLAIALDTGVGYYWDGSAWQPLSAAAVSSLTVEEVDGSPSLTNIDTLQFDQADGFVVSQPAAGVAKVRLTPSTVHRRWAFMFGGR